MTTPVMNFHSLLDYLPAIGAKKSEPETLAPALDAEVRHLDTWSAGRLAYYVDGRAGGRPVVLLHAVDAAASSREVAPLFNALRRERPVYALDLPGFGLSERTNRFYGRELYRAAVRRFLTDVVRAPGGADVIALSLSSEFASAIACEESSLIHSLVLVSPTGLSAEAPGASPVLRSAARSPFFGKALFKLLASRPSIRWFLKKNFVGEPDRGLVDYSVRTSHEPGAHLAPLSFLAGTLFTEGAFERLYERLDVPTLVVYDRDPHTRFDRLTELAAKNPHVELAHIAPTRGLPHFERPDATLDAVRRFWTQSAW